MMSRQHKAKDPVLSDELQEALQIISWRDNERRKRVRELEATSEESAQNKLYRAIVDHCAVICELWLVIEQPLRERYQQAHDKAAKRTIAEQGKTVKTLFIELMSGNILYAAH